MRTLLLAAAVSALLLSGCSSSEGGKLSDAEARAAAQKALEDFAEDFTSGSGDLSKITGEFEVDDGQLGDADVSFELERGKDGVLLIDMEAGGSGVTFNVQAYCSPTIEIISMGEASYASRPAVEGSCLGSGLDDSAFDVEGLEDIEIEEVEAHADGSVTARFSNETGEFTMEVDDRGRLAQLDLESDEGSGSFEMSYGPRRTIEAPEASQRVPADIGFSSNDTEDGAAWTVTSSPQRPMANEFQMQFQEGGTVVASAPLADGLAVDGDYRFSFDDADGNGRITEGDVLTFSAPDNSSATPALYDTWAEANVGANPIPGPGLLAGLAALGLVAALLRRRA